LKQHREIGLAVKVERTQKYLKDLSMQERRIHNLELIREVLLPLNPLKEHQQHEVTMPREDNNKNEKMNT
jgi:hypothetical protein